MANLEFEVYGKGRIREVATSIKTIPRQTLETMSSTFLFYTKQRKETFETSMPSYTNDCCKYSKTNLVCHQLLYGNNAAKANSERAIITAL
jgi:hypothetical protein